MAAVTIKVVAECSGGEHITLRLTAGQQVEDREIQRSDIKSEARSIGGELIDAFIAARTPAQLKTLMAGNGVVMSIVPA